MPLPQVEDARQDVAQQPTLQRWVARSTTLPPYGAAPFEPRDFGTQAAALAAVPRFIEWIVDGFANLGSGGSTSTPMDAGRAVLWRCCVVGYCYNWLRASWACARTHMGRTTDHSAPVGALAVHGTWGRCVCAREREMGVCP